LLEAPTLVRAPGGRAMFLAVHDLGSATDPPAPLGDDASTVGLAAGSDFNDTESYLLWALSGRHQHRGFPNEQGGLDGSDLRELALEVCSSWHPDFAQMIRMTDPSTIGLIHIRTSVPVDHWRTGKVTLIGDAIHSMTPYRGIGGNVALRDASLLCQKLITARRGELPLLQAIHEYETAMIEYGFRAMRDSLSAAEHAHSSSALALLIGNTMFRLVNAVPSLKARMFRRNAET
jgi:2-polyprenyl-6-methoxyphenol hydroxylase-like FAD-dependent oxidoreductase